MGIETLLIDSITGNNAFLKVVGLDPGETTGACVFQGPRCLHADQLRTKTVPEGAGLVRDFVNAWQPDVVVMEMYRVYSWKAEDHSWHNLHTPRLIGAIEYICHCINLPLIQQTAQQAKGFCTDEKLSAWGIYQPGWKHARDAIRHATYYLLFSVAKVQDAKFKPAVKPISGGPV